MHIMVTHQQTILWRLKSAANAILPAILVHCPVVSVWVSEVAGASLAGIFMLLVSIKGI
jgi:hypothetical protein